MNDDNVRLLPSTFPLLPCCQAAWLLPPPPQRAGPPPFRLPGCRPMCRTLLDPLAWKPILNLCPRHDGSHFLCTMSIMLQFKKNVIPILHNYLIQNMILNVNVQVVKKCFFSSFGRTLFQVESQNSHKTNGWRFQVTKRNTSSTPLLNV